MIPSHVFTVDTETTDKDPTKARIVELAILPFDGRYISMLINPGIPIPVETSAVHHITDVDVRNSPDWQTVLPHMQELLDSSEEVPVLVAHNAKYDAEILKDVTNVKWLCTYKAALRVWPDAPAHKNEVLRYWLGLPELGRQFVQNAHSALHDAIVTQQILVKLLEKVSLEQMIAWTLEPALMPRIPFGKHAGMAWSEIPAGYLDWLIKTPDMSEDAVFCAKKELERRKNGPTKH